MRRVLGVVSCLPKQQNVYLIVLQCFNLTDSISIFCFVIPLSVSQGSGEHINDITLKKVPSIIRKQNNSKCHTIIMWCKALDEKSYLSYYMMHNDGNFLRGGYIISGECDDDSDYLLLLLEKKDYFNSSRLSYARLRGHDMILLGLYFARHPPPH